MYAVINKLLSVSLCCILIFSLLSLTGCNGQYESAAEQESEYASRQGAPKPTGLFAASTENIHDYMPDLLAGKAVSDYHLLPCLKNFTLTVWTELDAVYEGDWWNPLWSALYDAAVGGGQSQHDRMEQHLRNYYLGKAFLVSDGAYSEGLMYILKQQWDYDRALYSTSLMEYFSAEEEAMLRRFLTYSLISDSDECFGLYPGDDDTEGTLYLDSYPVDFPFCFGMTEKSREYFQAESFGSGTVVESDGLQITYLHPCKGVYTIITVRAVRKGCFVGEIAIGDTEKTLLAQWKDKPLKKVDSISYDDEAYFGEQYDFAYAYTEEEGTKSAIFLIKDGIICGMELIDGLDGAMY